MTIPAIRQHNYFISPTPSFTNEVPKSLAKQNYTYIKDIRTTAIMTYAGSKINEIKFTHIRIAQSN